MRFRPVDQLRSFLRGGTAPATPSQRLRAWRAGFSGTTWLLYGLDDRPHQDYVPDVKAAAMANINGPVARSVLRNKLLFEQVVGRHARVPRTLAVVERGTVTALDPDYDAADAAELVSRLASTGRPVVLKPVDSSEGRGVHSVEVHGGELTLDKRPATQAEVAATLTATASVMVCELITQGGAAGRIFPGAVNTLRVVTMVDPADGEAFVVSALQRLGTARSAPTDNVSRGAIRSMVDVETGVLSPAGASWDLTDPGNTWKWDAHPETGERIAGVKLDGWNEVKELLLGLVRRLPFLIYVGWDVAITESGIVLVEGNHSPNLTQQVVGPYLADPRVRRVLRHHGVVT